MSDMFAAFKRRVAIQESPPRSRILEINPQDAESRLRSLAELAAAAAEPSPEAEFSVLNLAARSNRKTTSKEQETCTASDEGLYKGFPTYLAEAMDELLQGDIPPPENKNPCQGTRAYTEGQLVQAHSAADIQEGHAARTVPQGTQVPWLGHMFLLVCEFMIKVCNWFGFGARAPGGPRCLICTICEALPNDLKPSPTDAKHQMSKCPMLLLVRDATPGYNAKTSSEQNMKAIRATLATNGVVTGQREILENLQTRAATRTETANASIHEERPPASVEQAYATLHEDDDVMPPLVYVVHDSIDDDEYIDDVFTPGSVREDVVNSGNYDSGRFFYLFQRNYFSLWETVRVFFGLDVAPIEASVVLRPTETAMMANGSATPTSDVNALLDSACTCSIVNLRTAEILARQVGQALTMTPCTTQVRGVNGQLNPVLGKIRLKFGSECVVDALVMGTAQNLISTSQLLRVPGLVRALLTGGDEVIYVNGTQVMMAELRNGLWNVNLLNPNSREVPFGNNN